MDFNGSFLARIRDLAGANPIMLVVTKVMRILLVIAQVSLTNLCFFLCNLCDRLCFSYDVRLIFFQRELISIVLAIGLWKPQQRRSLSKFWLLEHASILFLI